WQHALVLTKPGRGSLIQWLYGARLKPPVRFTLRPAATLQGRVTNTNGQPVANARVWAHALLSGPIDGVGSTRTDADGRYAIRDMAAWGPDTHKPTPIG